MRINNSIQKRLGIVLVCFSLLPLIIMASYSHVKTERELLESKANQLQQKALETINDMNELLFFATEAVQSWASSGVMARQLSNKEYQRMAPVLQNYYHSYGIFDEIVIANKLGKIVAASSEEYMGKQVTSESWFVDSLSSGRQIIGDFSYIANIDSFSIAIATPIFGEGPSADILGVLVAYLSWSELLYLMDNIHLGPETSTPKNYAVLTDRKGNAIAGPEFLLGIGEESLPTVVGRNIVDEGLTRTFDALYGKSGYSFEEVNGEQRIVAYASSEQARYKNLFSGSVFISQSRDITLRALIYQRYQMFAIALIVFVVGLVLAYFVSRSLTRPLLALTYRAEAISNGELEGQLPVTSNNEIGKLTKSFNKMAMELDHNIRELKSSRDKALAAERTKSQFLANMSHEIRTPMNAIMGFTSYLLSQDMPNQYKDYLSQIDDASHALLSVINDILDFSKVDAGKLELHREFFDIESFLESQVDLFRESVNRKSVDLYYEKSLNVPSTLLGDSARLRQILTNLIGNAVKFTHQGEISVFVSMKSQTEDREILEFRVSDTGIGISESYLPKLFGMFSQEDTSSTREYEGTGLGLAITKKLIHLMGGEIAVDSKKGVGSTFVFTAVFERKLEKNGFSDNYIDLTEYKKPASLKNIRGSHVVLCYSNHSIRRVIAESLVQVGAQVSLADVAEDAFELHANATPFTLIIDSAVIEGDIDTKISHWRRVHKQLLNVIVVAPDTSMSVLADEVLTKPVSYRRLLERLGNRLARVSSVNELAEEDHAEGAQDFSHDVKHDSVATREDAEVVSSMNVLLVEDNPVNQMIAKLFLNKINIEVDIAANGKEAVEAARKKPYDIILMDIQMPLMNGLEATKIIRQELSQTEVPIIAMTAKAMKDDKEECLLAGMNDYLSKPYKKEQLFELIDKWAEVEEMA